MSRFLPFFVTAFLLGACLAQDVGPLAQPVAPAQGSGQGIGPLAMAGNVERPKNARTLIESDDGADFENASNSADFTGHVFVKNSQFDLTCDKLHVILRADRKGLEKVVAIGNVVIVQEKKNDRGDLVKSIGKCGKATYVASTGDVTMEEWPQIQQGINNLAATQQNTVMILNAKGKSRTIGGQRTMIVDQGGDHSVTP
jgi:lipopolysaccharide export system protein LptA